MRWTARGMALLIAIVLTAWIVRRLRMVHARRIGGSSPARGDVDALAAVYRRFLEVLARRGVRRPAHLTPLEFAHHAVQGSGMPGEVRELTELFCRARYGGQSLTEADLRRARGLLRNLRGRG